VDLVVQFREEDRRTLRQLENLPVSTAGGRQSIGSIAEFAVERGPSEIERENRLPTIDITANTTGDGTSFRMMGEVQQILDQVALPPGYQWSFGRWERFAQQDQQGSQFALLFAALLVFLIMAALFESFVQPFVIMLSIPFAFIGVGVVMRLGSQSFDNNTTMGLVILLGVVVNNAIVLIDHVNHLRAAGLERSEALIVGGRHRLRPILMTALTTILGLAPMVAPIFFPGLLGSAEGRAGNWAPVGLVILGGLTTSTFLTLLIIPTFYSLVDDLTAFCRRVVHSA
jgi:HAE1 family hydrophobic/amphiphilic exporter-1